MGNPCETKNTRTDESSSRNVVHPSEKVPMRITSDNGKEFMNAAVQALFRAKSIQHYTTQVGDKRTTGLVERFNRTVRE